LIDNASALFISTWRSTERSCYRVFATHSLREAEISQLDVTTLVDQHVFWLDVAMHDLKDLVKNRKSVF
jgi:hypothetical protein